MTQLEAKLIAIEGIDGSGKETQCKKIKAFLNYKGIRSQIVSYPRYHEPAGKLIRAFLMGEYNAETLRDRALLYIQDRNTEQAQIRQWLKNGTWVICDRYSGSNIAHQLGSEIDNQFSTNAQKVWDWEHLEYRHLVPDLTLVLDCCPQVCLERLARKKNRDLKEEDLDYLIQSHRNYLLLSYYYPHVHYIQMTPDSKELPLFEAQQKVLSVIRKQFNF